MTAAAHAMAQQATARLVSNSRWNLLAFAVSVLVNFATLPVVVAAIGLESFGAAGLVIAVYAPFSLVGTVLGQALVREMSPLFAAGDARGVTPVLSAGLVLCALGSAAVVLGLALAAPWLAHLTNEGRNGAQLDWTLAFLVAGLGWAAQQGTLVLQSAFAATQRFAPLAAVSALCSLVSAACVVVASLVAKDALGFLVGTAAGFLFSLALWVTLFVRLVPGVPLFGRFGKPQLGAIGHFGKWQGSAHFAGQVGNQIDRYVLGALAPLAVVGQFSVAMRLQEVVHMGLLKATEVLFPHFTVTAADPVDKRARFYVQCSWLMNVVGVAALAPLVPLAAPLVTLWVGAETAQGAAPMLRTLATAGVLGCGVNVYYYFAMGTGQAHRIAAITTAHSVLTVLFTVATITVFGPMAAGAGYLVANALRLAATLWFTERHFNAHADVAHLVRNTLPPLAAGLAAMWAVWAAGWVTAGSWPLLLASYVVLSIVAAAAGLLATGVTHEGRAMSAQVLRTARSVMARGS